MELRRQREVALAAIAAIIVAVAVYRTRSMSSVREASASAPSPGATATKPQKGTQKGLMAQVDLAALNAPRPEPVDVTRNPFRFRPKPPPPPAPVQPVAPPPAAAAAPLPRIPLKFIGLIESEKAGHVAVLSDDRGVYYGREGETIEGRYRILKIGVESIDLAYVDGRGRQTIRLTGQ